MIKVEGLYKNYGDFEALKDINLTIPKGSVYGIIGSNGAGKTTLLKTISGIYKADKGSVKIEDENVYENIHAKKRMFFVLDDPYYYPNYSIKEMASFYKLIYKSYSNEKYENLKDVFKIDENKKIKNLSKGMKRQVIIWLALSLNIDVLILDEPLDGLDAVMRQKVKKIIFEEVLERQLTVIISSHNLRELEDFCDHIAIIHSGRVIKEKDIDELKNNIFKIQSAFSGDVPKELTEKLDILYYKQSGKVTTFIVKGDRKKSEDLVSKYEPILLDIIPLSLEEIFIHEMGEAGYEKENVLL